MDFWGENKCVDYLIYHIRFCTPPCEDFLLVAVDRVPVRHEVLVKPVQHLHGRILNGEASDIAILSDPLLGNALGQRDEPMLHRPSHHQLSRGARVFLRQ